MIMIAPGEIPQHTINSSNIFDPTDPSSWHVGSTLVACECCLHMVWKLTLVHTANLPTNIVDFVGLDSSTTLI